MRIIAKEIGEAFLHGRPRKIKNTETDGKTVWLFGNRIMWRDEAGNVWVTLAGYNTKTTRSRLNDFCTVLGLDARFATRLGIAYMNGKRIDDDDEIMPPVRVREVTVDGITVIERGRVDPNATALAAAGAWL